MTVTRRHLGSLLLAVLTLSGCVDYADDSEVPDLEGAMDLDDKADGLASREPYLAMFSPGVLQSTRTQTIFEGQRSAVLGFVRGVGCHVERDDQWKTHDLVIAKGATFAVNAQQMTFLRFSSGQLGFAMRWFEAPDDLHHVPLVMYCWGSTMPTPEEARDTLVLGSNVLSMTFTPSGATSNL